MQCLSPKRLACMTLWDSLKRPLPLSKRVPRRLLSLLCTMEVIPRVLSCLANLHLQTSGYIQQGLSRELCRLQKPFEVLQAVTSCSYTGASHSASPQKTTMFGKGLRAVLSPFGIRRFSGVFQASHAVFSAQMPAVSAYLLSAFLSARCATARASQSGWYILLLNCSSQASLGTRDAATGRSVHPKLEAARLKVASHSMAALCQQHPQAHHRQGSLTRILRWTIYLHCESLLAQHVTGLLHHCFIR